MSAALDPSLEGLDDCGCCAGVDAAVPVQVQNRAGLPAVAYRVGTYATFYETLLARLTSGGAAALQPLTARDDDFTPALLDAWAVVGDVLTFYQERIANEQYLRTATERRSVLELARAIGYSLAPGAAAATWLAFTLEDAPGAPAEVVVAPGTRAQSLPGPGERPQSFETVEAVAARPGWNALLPRPTRPQALGTASTGAWIRGATTAIRVGDPVMLLGSDTTRMDLRTVTGVTRDAVADRTWISFDAPPAHDHSGSGEKLYVFRQTAALFGYNAPAFALLPESTRRAYEGNSGVKTKWEDFAAFKLQGADLDLDALYSNVLPGSWVVLRGTATEVFQVKTVSEVTRADFALFATVTRAGLASTPTAASYPLRGTVVLAQSEELPLAEEDDLTPVQGQQVELAAKLEAFPGPRTVIVHGRLPRVRLTQDATLVPAKTNAPQKSLADASELLVLAPPQTNPAGTVTLRVRDEHGVEGTVALLPANFLWIPAHKDDPQAAETALVDAVDATDPFHPKLKLHVQLANAYDRAACTIAANVAAATHGEAVAETLGSGDATVEWPRFALRQPPLTHVPDDSVDGVASTLEVRVGELRWHEVETLYGRGPRERVYTTRRTDEGTTVVQFGDGRTGARLPTGAENVKAAYRKGIGRDGNVRAGQISLLMTRPLGLRGVVNPLAATGGQEPQEMADARDNAPLTVLTMGRVVSLRDYHDFARGYAGVAKTHAVWSWDAGTRGVFVTVAGPEGAAVPAGGKTQTGLLAALAAHGDAHVPARVVSYRAAPFHLKATVHCDPDHLAATVKAAVEAALRGRFGFAARGFGERVALSQVQAVIQGVPGVRWVEVTLLYRGDAPAATREPWLPAEAPEPGADAAKLKGAELLTLELRPDDITTVTP
jgi:uncharacterized phage protein gp47/JayE